VSFQCPYQQAFDVSPGNHLAGRCLFLSSPFLRHHSHPNIERGRKELAPLDEFATQCERVCSSRRRFRAIGPGTGRRTPNPRIRGSRIGKGTVGQGWVGQWVRRSKSY
jgi:hypothetical protein